MGESSPNRSSRIVAANPDVAASRQSAAIERKSMERVPSVRPNIRQVHDRFRFNAFSFPFYLRSSVFICGSPAKSAPSFRPDNRPEIPRRIAVLILSGYVLRVTKTLNPLGRLPRFVLGLGLLVSLFNPWICTGAEKVDFSRQILPILSENCFNCHGPDADHRKAKLRLDDETDAKKDRDGDVVIVPGNSLKSLLVSRIETSDPDDLMPPPDSRKKLSPQQIALLKRWIEEGATWGEHWAFTPLKRLPVPAMKAGSNPVDAFVAQKLAGEKLKPSPAANRTTLIRRVTLDLTGLPPTPSEVSAFLSDRSTQAYEKVVDRLLASPAYGERMAWDWMEAARYADSNGYQGDGDRTMWPWRDWVVKAFNDNMPYDKFTVAQLAGDLLPKAASDEKLATGFLRNHPINGEGGRIADENRVDYVMDMAETTSTVWLGLTVGCARCHDHKFDPISQRDYYSLFSFFNQTPVDGGGGNPQSPPVLAVESKTDQRRLAELDTKFQNATDEIDRQKQVFLSSGESGSSTNAETAISSTVQDLLKKPAANLVETNLALLAKEFETTAPDFTKALRETEQALKARADYRKSIPKVMVMEDLDSAKARKTFLLQRGLYNKPGEEVSAATPAKLPPMKPGQPLNRLGLAQWIVSAENPLPARVTVNRAWQMFFGAGLVKTSEDFGTKGEFPVHPELLDWLACEFRDSGWDTKRLVRLIVTSSTYQQSSKVTKDQWERDPENRLLARGSRFRMPSWMLRDQALAASGLLVGEVGGPPVKSYQPPGVWEETTFGNKKYKQDHGDSLYRRSLYIFWRRIIGPTEFFDTPSRMTCSVKPTRNNTPLHALITLNDTTYVEAARHLAERAMLESFQPEKRAESAFQWVTGRKPNRSETKALLAQTDLAKGEFSSTVEDAKALLAVGESKRNESLDAVEHADRKSVV